MIAPLDFFVGAVLGYGICFAVIKVFHLLDWILDKLGLEFNS